MSAPGFRNFILGLSFPELPPPEEGLHREATGPLLSSQEQDTYINYQDQAQFLLQGITSSFSGRLREEWDSGGRSQQLRQIQNARYWIREGYREGYFYGLRAAFLILPYQNPDQTRSTLREMTAWVQDYQNFLETGDEFTDYERFRYLYAGTQFTHATLRYLQNITDDQPDLHRVAEEYIPLFENQLRQLHRHLIRYYNQMEQDDIPSRSDLTALYDEVQLQEALWENDIPQVQHWAYELSRQLRARAEDSAGSNDSWFAGWEDYFIHQDSYLDTLTELNLPNPGETTGAWVNGFSADILVQISATLDLWNEESESDVQTRYRILGTTLAAWNLLHPELNLQQSLELLEQRTVGDRAEPDLQAFLLQSEILAPRVESMRQELGIDTWEEWWQQVHEGMERIQHWHRSGGSRMMEAVFQRNRQSHPISLLAQQLTGFEAELESLQLPPTPETAARELFRRGPAGQEELESLAEFFPHLPLDQWLETLGIPAERDQHHERISQDLLEYFLSGVDSDREHESAAATAVLQLFTQESDSGTSPWSLPPTVVRRAGERLAELRTFTSRAGRIFNSLLGFESLATLACGVFYAELLPALVVGRLGRTLGIARVLAPQGFLRTGASLAHGFSTGLLLGTSGALLQNHRRAQDGFETHYLRDMVTGATINSLVFLGATAANLGVHHMLARREAQTYILGRALSWRPLLGHGASWLTGGTLAWGLGVTTRGLQSGDWSTSGDEAATHYLTLLGFELFGGAFRQTRRYLSTGRELGMEPNLLQRSAGRLLVNDWLPVLGPQRTQSLLDLVESSLRHNPALRGRRLEVLRRFAREEFRQPGASQQFMAWMRQGHSPVLVGPEGRQQLVLLPPEALTPNEPFSEAMEPPAPLLLPANTQSEGIFEASSLLPQYRFSVQGPRGEIHSDPALLLSANRRRILLTRESFNFLNDPEETRILPREGFALMEFLEDGSVTLRIPERLSDLNETLRPSDENRPLDTLWRLRNGHWEPLHEGESLSRKPVPNIFWYLREGTWHRIQPGDPAMTLDPGTILAFGRLQGQATRLEGEPRRPGRNTPHIEITGHDAIPIGELQTAADTEGRVDDPLFVHFDWLEPTSSTGRVQRVALEPNGKFPMSPLTLMRSREGESFRILAPPRQFFQIARMGPEGTGPLRGWRGTDQPQAGEIGDTILVRTFNDGQTMTTRILLDDPEGSASHLPVVRMSYGETETEVPFRPSVSDLNFGRLHQPSFFQQKYISRTHFDLRIAALDGQPRYWLTVRSNFGLLIQGRSYVRGESIPLQSGQYEIYFPMEAGKLEQEAADGPMRLVLPPLTRIFPGWRVSGLVPNHDQGFPRQGYPAQQGPTPTEPPPSGEVPADAADTERNTVWNKMFRIWTGRDQD